MKNIFAVSIFIVLFSCKQQNKIEEKITVIPVAFKIERFDKLFYESKPADLASLKAKYPFLFPSGNEDSVWVNKLKDPLLQQLYKEVENKYGSIDEIENDLERLFQHIQYYFPKYRTPRVITIINEVDTDAKAIYTDTIAFISLDCYLGKDHPFYADFTEYQRVTFQENQILPDFITFQKVLLQ